MPGQRVLSLRFLGEMEVRRGSRLLPLPQSKKTRALLAYLALSGRPQRRDRLCSLLWDVADDPRGALRWSLSKIRTLVDDRDNARIVADRDTVSFDAAGASIDVLAAHDRLAAGTAGLSTEDLVSLSNEFRGEFLEGLELGGFLEFQAWCLAEREDARRLQTSVVRALIGRFAERPEEALPYARNWAQADPLDEEARASLVGLLRATGRVREAEEQYRSARRVLEELGAPLSGALDRARKGETARLAAPAARGADAVAEQAEPPRVDPAAAPPLVGRLDELGRLRKLVDAVCAERRQRIVLLTGEPGVGKSRLLAELTEEVRRRRGTVLDGRAYEVEVDRPYGPWVDALRRLDPLAVGPDLGGDLGTLLPELGSADGEAGSRERLFGGVAELLASRAHSMPPVLLVFDDVQWCDGASTALLHYVARMNRHRPVLIALAARAGEITDNASMCRALRALRRESLLSEIAVGPLGRPETERLVLAVAPTVDAARVYADSGGNPLFALEAARAPHRPGDLTPTLSELVRERVERLPPEAAHVLRWAAVLGQTFAVERLLRLAAMDEEVVVGAVEVLERHALLYPSASPRGAGSAYAFAHDVVRGAVYGDLSVPRRRLMHQRVAVLLAALPEPDESLAAEIAHHAGLAGDGALAARACIAAGRVCLRLFANDEAEVFVRRGIRYAQELREPERVTLLLDLQQVAVSARRPEELDATARHIEQLAEQAMAQGELKHARLGFHMVAWLRWEHGEWTDAQRYMLQAERVSRASDEAERVVALAEAARCLALLQRDLGQAEALFLEAGATAKRVGVEPLAIPDGLGMLRLHQGKFHEARALFEKARAVARRDGHRDGEFQALAHLVVLEVECERWRTAAALTTELLEIASKLRGGSEGPFARALAALCAYAGGAAPGESGLDAAIEELRLADAKHRLAYVLTRAAELDLRRGAASAAGFRAAEALRAATTLEAPSEMALANAQLARVATALGDSDAAARRIDALAQFAGRALSTRARMAVDALIGTRRPGAPPKGHKRKSPWKTSSSKESSTNR